MWQWYLIIEHIIWYIKSVCIVYMLVILIYTHINVQNNGRWKIIKSWVGTKNLAFSIFFPNLLKWCLSCKENSTLQTPTMTHCQIFGFIIWQLTSRMFLKECDCKCIGQAQTCGGLKPVNEISTLQLHYFVHLYGCKWELPTCRQYKQTLYTK
jgi:hypothetical protein